MRALNIAGTGMMAQQLNVEVISNNIANMNTTGFKRARAEFTDLLYQSERRQGAQSSETGTVVPAGVQIGLGVKASAVTRVNTQGNLVNTGNALDLALDGNGYFVVTLPNNDTAYTRAGALQKSPDGTIVTLDGFPLQPGIVIPENARDIVINQSGEVIIYVDGDPEPQTIGQLQLASFINEAGLEAIGDNLYLETAASGPPQQGLPGQPGYAKVRQKYVESANVNIVQEITDLISAQRAYEMNSKVVETADQMSSTISNMR